MRKGRRGEAKRQMISWLQEYEEKRIQINSNSNSNSDYSNYKEPKEPREPNPDWISNKYNLQDDWRTVREIYLPTIQMQLGPAVSRLKKLWKSYRISKANGETTRDTAWAISQIEAAIGLVNPTQFQELEDQGLQYEETEDVNYQGSIESDFSLTPDELAAQHDELVESKNDVLEDIWDGSEQTIQEVMDDDSWSQDDQEDPWDEDEDDDPWAITEPTDLDRRMATDDW